MTHHEYKTHDTCSQLITFDLDGDRVHNVVFYGGCPGNLKAIPLLVEGMTVDEIVGKIGGVTCGRRSTSCANQLSKAVAEAYEQDKRGSDER